MMTKYIVSITAPYCQDAAALHITLERAIHTENVLSPESTLDTAAVTSVSMGKVSDLGELKDKVAYLESMRPLWSIDVQSTAHALAGLWELLGVKGQTAAVVKIKRLLGETS